MYAISHAVTALALKRRWPTVALWRLLLAVQAIELLWVLFVYLGVERPTYTANAVHLGFLPYSHSVTSAAVVALAVWLFFRFRKRDPVAATALAVAVMSHVVLDIIQHEPDIALLPTGGGPHFGLALGSAPMWDFVVELAFGIACWRLFRGTAGLLIAIVAFNLMNLPLMFPQPGAGAMLAAHPAVLPTVILFQIVITWLGVWYFARRAERAFVMLGDPRGNVSMTADARETIA